MNSINFMPYFPDRGVDENFGPFHIWNWIKYKDTYLSDKRSRAFLERYFSIYKKYNGRAEDRITIIDCAGVTASDKNELPLEIRRFAQAVMLAHVVMMPLASNEAYFASASDNYVAFAQPFDPGSDAISLIFGSYVKTIQAAGSLERLTFITPQHTPDPLHGLGDQRLLRQLAPLCGKNSMDIERLFRSLPWVGFAFSNVSEHLYESRIVAMATAFEILLDMPEEDKTNEFSSHINTLLLSNKLPRSTRKRKTKSGNEKSETDNEVGWWCRKFYGLRSKVVHGDKLDDEDYKTNNVENLRISLQLFRECVDGILVNLGELTQQERMEQFWICKDWIDVLKLPHDAFY
jgi:Apea-like HEPN